MNTSDNHRLLKALSFAADKHRFQRRKDVEKTPYINHPIAVALTLVELGHEENTDLLVAALLHDTIEDTKTSPEEIETEFGHRVLSIVLEVTDDKNLPKEERKHLQIIQAEKKSPLAKKLKLADKICNVTDILHNPPGTWSIERRLAYLGWVERVMAGLIGSNPSMEKHLQELIQIGREQLVPA